MPDKIFNAQKGTYQSGPVKLIGNLYWDNWRLRVIMDEPDYYMYDDVIRNDYFKWLNLPFKTQLKTPYPKKVKKARKEWKRKDRMYKSLPVINTILATLPFQLILIPMKIMVITW